MTCTGWTWEYIDSKVTIPQVEALSRCWVSIPPPAIQLRRIAQFLGIKDAAPDDKTKSKSETDLLREFSAAGIPVIEGRPDDPMLDLLGL